MIRPWQVSRSFVFFCKSSEICDAKGVESAVDGIEYFGTAMLSAIFGMERRRGGGGEAHWLRRRQWNRN